MHIDGLTAEQVLLLDKMWSLETTEELTMWMRSLTSAEFHQVLVLRELLVLSLVDEEVEKMQSYPAAKNMIMAAYKKH